MVKIAGVEVTIIKEDKIKLPVTRLGKTKITKGLLNSNDLGSNAKTFILKHERYHQLTHRRKMFLLFWALIFIISFCISNLLVVRDILIVLVLSILIPTFTLLPLSLTITYENEIQADLFAAKELGKDKSIIAIESIQNSELGRKLEKGFLGIFHKLMHPTLKQRLTLIKAI